MARAAICQTSHLKTDLQRFDAENVKVSESPSPACKLIFINLQNDNVDITVTFLTCYSSTVLQARYLPYNIAVLLIKIIEFYRIPTLLIQNCDFFHANITTLANTCIMVKCYFLEY